MRWYTYLIEMLWTIPTIVGWVALAFIALIIVLSIGEKISDAWYALTCVSDYKDLNRRLQERVKELEKQVAERKDNYGH